MNNLLLFSLYIFYTQISLCSPRAICDTRVVLRLSFTSTLICLYEIQLFNETKGDNYTTLLLRISFLKRNTTIYLV